MIPSITEINFPSYATLHQATVSLQEMGERTITTQVRIDGDIVPDFSGWELEFKGERFVLPNTNPQALKDNTTRNSLVDLTFVSWPVEEMKRYFFMSLSEVETGVAIADQYKASVIMPVEQFVELFNRVLRYYFGNKVRIDLFQAGSHIYSENPVSVEINYSYIWDVLTKFYELFGLRWQIEYESASDTYVIKVGYSAEAIDDHDFEYGYSGGLLRFERQVQDADITNILLGRGGEKNLPYRYFKREDPQNPNWTPDPDAIYELRNIYFDKLRDANFRWYVRGWMKNENRDKTWENAGYSYPSYTDVPEEYQYAYNRGLTDARFNPVEFVRDADSIEKYGERWGALDDNDDVYPTIQGIERDPIGRVDEVVAVSEIVTDDVDAAAQSASTTATIGGALSVTQPIAKNSYKEYDFQSEAFTVPDGKTANLTVVWLALVNGSSSELVRVDTSNSTMVVVNNETGTERPAAGIPAGTYHAKIHVRAYNDSSSSEFLYVTYGVSSLTAAYSDVNENAWKPTFDIWVKNIWETSQNQGESNADYSTRVWGKILGDRVGNEAKIVFSTGFMSISEDYEFTIASYPVVDRSKTINGVPSEWKITLYKSSAEFDATGLFIPNSQTGGKPIAGDKFFFIGIDMPFIYVRWAEEQLTAVKTESLEKTADINPTWVINLDKVRVHTIEDVDYGTALADRLASGSQIRIRDSRFTNGNILTLYVQSITYTWNEPSDGSPYLVPNIEVVLSDKVVSVESPVQKIQNSVDVIRSTYAKTSDIESVVRRVASPLFLKKTGESDSSVSPTTFASRVSSKSFRQGDIGGEGWGYYEDGEGNATLELDRLIVRKDMTVNALVANQISYVGGKQIFSAANIECTQVVDSDAGYVCYFDQKQGSVSNLFQVGDIAMGQVFDSENNEESYYRAVVTAVSDNSITLSKTQKDGAGIPEKGDIIVQYGNTSQSARQYVIIRDVIGGGYERMLSGLDSVTASGDEYYFAGRQSGSTPRVFIGDSENEYVEYANGVLNIKGRLSVMKTDGTYQSLAEYINNAAQINASLQEQIDGKIQTFYPQTGAPDDYVPALNNYPASSWVDASDKNKHVGDIFYNREGKAWRFNYDGTTWSWVSIADEEVQTALQEAERANQGVSGLEYLKEATNSGTLVDGGLVLTSLIQLGQASGSTFNVLSGINGVLDQTLSDPTRSIAAWYGGPMIDHEASPSAASYAKSLFRMDGSGYLASGNIAWSPDGSGKIPGISWNGDSVIISGNVKLESLSGDSVTELTNYVRQLVNWFGEDADGNIFVRKNGENARGFYSYGFITAGGIGTSGGGGGGGLIETLHRYADLGGSFSDSANDTFNAYTINKINADLSARIAALEGGSATSITTTGSGNVITALSKSGTVITATKGITALTSHQTVTLASGTNNGTLKLTTAAGTTDNIAVQGLAALAYKSSLDFSELTGSATASQVPSIENLTNFGSKVYDASLSRTKNYVLAAPSGANGVATFRKLVAADIPSLAWSKITSGKPTTLSGYGITDAYTKSETDSAINTAIEALPNPMLFQGSLGTDGTITTLPAASSSNEGWTYKVITAGTYAGQAAKIGDMFISNGSAWIYVPSGDEPSGTVTSVGLSVPTGLSVSGSPITTSGTLKITLASGYSIPTTAKQTAWDAKYDKPSTGIPNADLVNSSITIGSKSISLGGSATLTQIGVPAWAQASALAFGSLPSMYIAKNAVQSSSAVQDLTGLGNLEPDTNNTKNLGSSSKIWSTIFANDGVYYAGLAVGSSLEITSSGIYLDDSSALSFASNNGYISITETYGVELSANDQDGTELRLINGAANFKGHVFPRSNNTYSLGSPSLRWSTIYGVNGDFSGTMNVSGATSLSSGLTVSGNSSLHGNVTIGAGTTYPSFTLNANSQQGLKITGEDATGSNDYIIFKLGKLGVHTTPTSSSSTVDINGTAFVSGLARFDAGVKLVTTKKIWFGDTYYIELDSNNYLHTNAPFYSDGFITAGGIGTSGGSGGGGLIETLHRYADLGGSFSDSANDTFNAYTINKINTDLAARITALEGGSATDVTTTGSGNVVSSVTKSGTTITVTKGITALTSHQSLDGYVNEIATGTGNYITGVSKSGKKLTFTYGTLPTTIALSNVTGADDLKAIEALTGTRGLLKKTAANTWTLDTTTYLSSHQTVTLASGTNNGTLKITTAAGTTDNIAVKGLAALAYKASLAFSELTGSATASQVPSIENLTNFSTRVYDATTSRTKNYVLAAPSTANGAATFRKLVASDIPDLSATYLTSHQTVTLASGTNNGTLKLTTAAGTTDNIAVTGLGSLAYKSSLVASDIPDISSTYLTTTTAASTYVKLNPGAAEQTISSQVSYVDKGVVNLWRNSGDHASVLGFSNGTTETYLGGIGFRKQGNVNLYRWDGSDWHMIYDESNLTLTKSLVTDALGGTPSSMWYNYNASAGYWKIHIKSKASWFLTFNINLYSNYTSSVIRICGYNYSNTKQWYNPRAFMVGSTSTNSIDVTFGKDGDRDLWVVVPVSSYNGISITDVVYGNTGTGLSYNADAFEITKVTEIPETVVRTITVYPPLSISGGTISGDLEVSGTLEVTGATTLSSTLNAGATTLASLSVTGAATIGSTLGVTGAVTLSSTLSAGASTLASLGVTGAATIGTTLSVTGATTLSSTLGVTGATTLSSTLGVTGAATLSSTLGVTGVSTLAGGLTLGTSTNAQAASMVWDETNNAWHLQGNFYADGFITAGGIGSGGGSGITIDSALSSTSENPVQNKVIYAAIGDVESLLAAI